MFSSLFCSITLSRIFIRQACGFLSLGILKWPAGPSSKSRGTSSLSLGGRGNPRFDVAFLRSMVMMGRDSRPRHRF